MTTRLKIALVYDDSLDRYGGIPQYLATLAGELIRHGHQVELLVGETAARRVASCPVHSLAINMHVRFNGNRLSMPVLPRLREIQRLARYGEFDVVHVQLPYSPLMSGVLIANLPARVALVGTFHVASERMLPRLGGRILGRATARGRRRFDEIVCVSEQARRFARHGFGLGEARIVPNLIDLSAWSAANPSGTRAGLVVFVGALVPRKGPELLVAAFARVHAVRSDARLVIAGDGPLRAKLMRQVRRLGLAEAVQLVGPISEREKQDLLRGAQLACYPSRFGESCGLVLLEAMASGGPAVVAGDNPGYAETLRAVPELLCSLVPEALAERMLHLMDDKTTRMRLVANGLDLVAGYDGGLIANEILCVYRSAMARRVEWSAEPVAAVR